MFGLSFPVLFYTLCPTPLARRLSCPPSLWRSGGYTLRLFAMRHAPYPLPSTRFALNYRIPRFELLTLSFELNMVLRPVHQYPSALINY